jgi:hypothetical protein
MYPTLQMTKKSCKRHVFHTFLWWFWMGCRFWNSQASSPSPHRLSGVLLKRLRAESPRKGLFKGPIMHPTLQMTRKCCKWYVFDMFWWWFWMGCSFWNSQASSPSPHRLSGVLLKRLRAESTQSHFSGLIWSSLIWSGLFCRGSQWKYHSLWGSLKTLPWSPLSNTLRGFIPEAL